MAVIAPFREANELDALMGCADLAYTVLHLSGDRAEYWTGLMVEEIALLEGQRAAREHAQPAEADGSNLYRHHEGGTTVNTIINPNDKIKEARREKAAEIQAAQQLENMRTALASAVELGDMDGAQGIARGIRNKLLEEVDAHGSIFRAGLDVPEGATFSAWLGFFKQLGQYLRGDWAKYRQALLDVPQQEGFPASIVWPEMPKDENDEQGTQA